MSAGAFPVAATADPLVASLQAALAAIEVIGPGADGEVILRLRSTWGETFDWALGTADRDPAADAWLAWRDLLA